MLFALPDYDLACGQVISRVTKDIARVSDPGLSQIKVVPMKGTVSSVMETRDDMALTFQRSLSDSSLASKRRTCATGTSRLYR